MSEETKKQKPFQLDLSKSFENPKQSKPHRCPVCFGKGVVPNGFYTNTSGLWASSSVMTDKCRSCVNGIIWG